MIVTMYFDSMSYLEITEAPKESTAKQIKSGPPFYRLYDVPNTLIAKYNGALEYVDNVMYEILEHRKEVSDVD